MVRVARVEDAKAFISIYAPFVEGTHITFEETVPGVEAMARAVAKTLESLPWLTLEIEGSVAGYAYASPFRARAAYRWGVDVSIYLAPEARGHGHGRALYGVLLDLLERQGFATAYAIIALPSAASVGLHEALGFRPIGVFPGAGYKAGAWHDVGWWSRELAPRSAPPREPTPFSEFVDGPAAQEGHFTGSVRIKPLFPAEEPSRLFGSLVSFEPGAHTVWHTHPLGQTLVVVSGLGWVQREGGPVEGIRPGDLVRFAPGERHWHGATPTTAMSHVALVEALDGKTTDLLGEVGDEEYRLPEALP